MPLPPPRKPRPDLSTPAVHTEAAPPLDQAVETPLSELESAERRRLLREDALRAMKLGNHSMNLPAPAPGDVLPPMPSRKMAWWKYALLFPLIFLVVAGLFITMMIGDSTPVLDRTSSTQAAICGMARIAPPPATAKNLSIVDPSESPNRKYIMGFSAYEAEIAAWVEASEGLKGLTPEKDGMRSIYRIQPPEKVDEYAIARKAVVTVDRFAKTVEVVVDGYDTAVKKESMLDTFDRRTRENKERAKAIAEGRPVPESKDKIRSELNLPVYEPLTGKRKSATEKPPAEVLPEPPAAPVDPALAEKRRLELEAIRIIQGGKSKIPLPPPPIFTSPAADPSPLPLSDPAPKPKIVE